MYLPMYQATLSWGVDLVIAGNNDNCAHDNDDNGLVVIYCMFPSPLLVWAIQTVT